MMQVWICGKFDKAWMLADIVRWAVGSLIAIEHADGIAVLEKEGLIKKRRHKPLHKSDFEEFDAYALTDAGFRELKEIGVGKMYDEAVRSHKWYLDRGCMDEVKK